MKATQKTRIVIAIVFLFFILINTLNPISIYAVNDFSNAKAMCVLESESGRVLYGKNINQKLPMASLTKIFTAVTVLENCNDLSQVVNVDDRAVGIEGTSIYLRKGEKLTVEELLYGMMLPSGNDAAMALAFFISQDIESFCKLMEDTAKRAGASSSKFKNPHGLDQAGHYTTAYDLSKITAYALENPKFKEIVSAKNKVISGNEEVEKRYLKNKNKLLNTFEGCNGVKTGFTDNAGRCFVSSAVQNEMTIICTVLNCGPMFEECANLMQKSFSEYKNYQILKPYQIQRSIKVENGRQKEVKTYTQKAFSYPLTEKEYHTLTTDIVLPNVMSAPIIKEKIVGKYNVYLDSTLIFSDDIRIMEEVRKDSLLEDIKDLIKKW